MSRDFISQKETDDLLKGVCGEAEVSHDDWQEAQELLDQEKMQPAYIRDVIDRHALNYDLDAAPDWVKGTLTDVKETPEKPLTLEHVKSIVQSEWEQALTDVDTAIARRNTWEILHYLLERVK